jgi:hypothetical protein
MYYDGINSYTPSIFITVSTESTNGAITRKKGDLSFDMKATGAERDVMNGHLSKKINNRRKMRKSKYVNSCLPRACIVLILAFISLLIEAITKNEVVPLSISYIC